MAEFGLAFFALATERVIRRGTFDSSAEFEQAIWNGLAARNGRLSPFIWKPSADLALGKVRRGQELNGTGGLVRLRAGVETRESGLPSHGFAIGGAF